MTKIFNQDSISFMEKLIRSSGQGEETYLPPPLHYIPPRASHQDAINEAQMVFFPVIDDLLSKTKISPLQIDVLVLNCSSFSPSPSLSSIIINKYSMKTDIKSFNISGMGCSAGVIGINIAQNLLKIYKNYYALVVSSEILSNNWYAGNDKSKMVLNSMFRMGCSAVLLTNKKEAKNTSKYKLFRLVTTQRAFDDKCYFAALREEDSRGITGFSVYRNSFQAFRETLKSNVEVLGSLILPFKEKIRYCFFMLLLIKKRFLFLSTETTTTTTTTGDDNNNKVLYVPDFTSVIQHFCIPTSGKMVVMEIGKVLKLSEREMEATLMTLKRFGNQSASSLWYVLAYMEAKERVKKGDKVWQVGIGSGFKCNSVIWECLRPIVNESKNGPWSDCITRYPVTSTA
ncbi:FAE1/Type III polyketide synthase-like protein [Macleaya cordata]|uniref:very-long-chain 3-oxoacyl-CoA synthase n=1 Tax=Macleaya cordata TaxID=56857 RepID=A0A200PMP0_MACCD|nr:FAE1/Type III polyketide synthase-like protein [Macleaya cordata]